MSGTGIAGLSHLTLYYTILPEVTVQVGAKAAAIVMSNYRTTGLATGGIGGYLSVGYIHQF